MRAQRQVRAHAKQACYTKPHPLPIPLSLFPCLYRPIPIALSLSAYLHPRQRVKIRDTALHHVPIRDTARVRSSHRLRRLPPVQQARRATTCAVSRHVEQLRLVLVHPGGARASQRRARTRCTLPLPPLSLLSPPSLPSLPLPPLFLISGQLSGDNWVCPDILDFQAQASLQKEVRRPTVL